MNLTETISMYAGGPGSGCRGPNCGKGFRKTGTSDELHPGGEFKGTKTTYQGKHDTLEVHRRPFEGGHGDVRTFVLHNGKKVHDGSESSARGFLRSNYGIRWQE